MSAEKKILSPAANLWQLDANRAKLLTPNLAASVELANPSLGLQQLEFAGSSVMGQLLGVSLANASVSTGIKVSDAFVRGGDLVASYAETEERHYSLEIYWRLITASNFTVVDLLLSLETDLLESFPRIATRSVLSSGEAWWVSDGGKSVREIADLQTVDLHQDSIGVVLRPTDAGWSYVEMSLAGDHGGVKFSNPSPVQIAIERDLAGSFLEKGVIRRLRLRGALVPREGDLQIAGQLLSEFAAETPPLTT